ncbi:DUF3244 domain-containing protein [Draconibacterium sp. IB214405]|uniref:DUF3244 domain-containing protein n=1 Tax=Draconibacterium sp. IB214405 TaxID=3097352 RepID=UPI002A172E67|nr:DUF3244 domain-containing protein [Draconibacterium sp. IB214405]MDX8341791.1 DUF3244 domain-containing protein [Draconibacterium sp. IB214405]
MKNLFLICFILFTILLPNISHSLNRLPINPGDTDTKKEIILDGSLDDSGSRSPQQNPIYAAVGSSQLEVNFLFDIGNIIIEIYSLIGGLVYEMNINTQTQQDIFINISDWDNGTYEIRFTNYDGNYLYGDFEIIH